MTKFRKKPVVIEAEQFTSESWKESEFLLKAVNDKANASEVWAGKTASEGRYYIDTLEGHMLVSEFDFIIQGVQGEFYPCKQDIFELTYEKV